MSAARNLAGLGNQNTFAVESVANEVGIASTAPSSTLDVRGEVKVGTNIQLGSAGVITASSYTGSFPILDASSLAVSGISTLVRLAVTDEVVTGIITALGLSGNLTGAAATITGALNVDGTTDSTSTTTGALIVDGGAAIAKNVYIGAGLSVAGTLTYEDVTSVDSVGLITAKSGVNITGGELTVGSGITMGIAGVATFSGTGDVHLLDNVRLNVGDASDLTAYHDGSNSKITHTGAGGLYIGADTFGLQNGTHDENYIVMSDNGSVDLYYDNVKVFNTDGNGIMVRGPEGGTANVYIYADEGDDNDDKFQLTANEGGPFIIGNRASGSVETNIECNGNGNVELFYDNTKKFETTNDGTVTTGIATATTLDVADKILHTGDTDTALRFPAANTFTVETAGAEDMRIASGKVGIGTNKVDGSGAKLRLGTNLLSRTQDFSDGGFTVVPTTGDTIATAQIMPLITAAGQGSSPNILRAGIAVESTDGRSGMDMLFLTRYAADGTALDVTDDEKMRITDGGRIGIGTTAPSAQVHIEGTETGLWIERNLQTLKFDANYGNGGDEAILASAGLRLYSGGTNERVRVHSGGTFEFKTGPLTEKVNITAGKLSANTNIDLADGMIHYFTTEETTTCTPNIRVDGSTTLNSVMQAGDAITVTVITTADATGYSANWTIDGNAVTEEWVGGSAPSEGGSDGLDIYCLTIICTHNTNTGDSGFKVIANLTNAT